MVSGKFYGKVGYGVPQEVAQSVWKDVIVEKEIYGDVLRNFANIRQADKVNSDVTVNNSLSLVADAFAYEHFATIKYVIWMGVAWTVSSVEVRSPRLILQIGEVYNGPKAEA